VSHTIDAGAGQRTLAIVERAHRGTAEKQFFTELYLATELHRQLGGLDILLRGQAVTYAVDAPPPPALHIGGHTVAAHCDPRADLRRLLEAGVRVWAEEPSLATYVPGGREALLPDVHTAAEGEFALRWPAYRRVCFL
jgi:hypothetical protein